MESSKFYYFILSLFCFDGSISENNDEILDIRNGRRLLCQNRPKLLEYCSALLLAHQDEYRKLSSNTERRRKGELESLERLKEVVNLYFDLRKKNIVTSNKNLKAYKKDQYIKHLNQ